MDRKTRKLLVQYKALHPKSNVTRLYIGRKGGRGLSIAEECWASELRGLEHYITNKENSVEGRRTGL